MGQHFIYAVKHNLHCTNSHRTVVPRCTLRHSLFWDVMPRNVAEQPVAPRTTSRLGTKPVRAIYTNKRYVPCGQNSGRSQCKTGGKSSYHRASRMTTLTHSNSAWYQEVKHVTRWRLVLRSPNLFCPCAITNAFYCFSLAKQHRAWTATGVRSSNFQGDIGQVHGNYCYGAGGGGGKVSVTAVALNCIFNETRRNAHVMEILHSLSQTFNESSAFIAEYNTQPSAAQ